MPSARFPMLFESQPAGFHRKLKAQLPSAVFIPLGLQLPPHLLLFLHFSSFTILCLLLVFHVIKSSTIETHRNSWGITMRSVTRITLFLTLLTVVGGAHLMFGQGTDLGTIQGSVKDTSGAVIANAKVTVTYLDTNALRQATGNVAARFEVIGVKSGRYKVTDTAPGMSTDKMKDIVVN